MLFRYIRANQGHSIPVELDLKAANVDVAYHGKRDRENVEYNVLKGRQMTHGKSSNTKDWTRWDASTFTWQKDCPVKSLAECVKIQKSWYKLTWRMQSKLEYGSLKAITESFYQTALTVVEWYQHNSWKEYIEKNGVVNLLTCYALRDGPKNQCHNRH